MTTLEEQIEEARLGLLALKRTQELPSKWGSLHKAYKIARIEALEAHLADLQARLEANREATS